MLAAEGAVHKRQRRVATPGFSIQNLRALVPLVFRKGEELKDKWMCMIEDAGLEQGTESVRLDVAHWISRATFDVIGLAGVSTTYPLFSLVIECDDVPLVFFRI
jgi:cytochrome P450